MSEATPLDTAHAAMDAAPDDDTARLRFFDRLSDAEVFLLLAAEAEGDSMTPEVFETEAGTFVLIFDTEERLANFVGKTAPYAALSGRMLAQMLEGQAIGLGLNIDVAPSSMLIPSDALEWLRQTLGNAPEEDVRNVTEIAPPAGVPEHLLAALDAKLAAATGLARAAYLVAATYEGGGRGHMLGIIGARPGAETALAQAVSEALTFSGIEAGFLDVGFFGDDDGIVARLDSVGLRFDLPEPEMPKPATVSAPGSDPDNPPKLR